MYFRWIKWVCLNMLFLSQPIISAKFKSRFHDLGKPLDVNPNIRLCSLTDLKHILWPQIKGYFVIKSLKVNKRDSYFAAIAVNNQREPHSAYTTGNKWSANSGPTRECGGLTSGISQRSARGDYGTVSRDLRPDHWYYWLHTCGTLL